MVKFWVLLYIVVPLAGPSSVRSFSFNSFLKNRAHDDRPVIKYHRTKEPSSATTQLSLSSTVIESSTATTEAGESQSRWGFLKRVVLGVGRKLQERATLAIIITTFAIGHRFGAGAAAKNFSNKFLESSTQAVVVRTSPSYLLTTFLLFVFVRELWNTTPVWLKHQIPFVAPIIATQEAEVDPEDLSNLASLANKLQSMFQKMAEKVEETATGNTRSAFLALMKLNSKLRSEYGHHRDARYDESGKIVKNPSRLLEGMDELFELAEWSYDELPDERAVKDALHEMGYHLVRHEKTSVPGSVDYFVAIHKERKLAVISIKGTSNIEDMLTDLCARAVTHHFEDGPFVPGGRMEIQCHEGVIFASKKLADDLHTLLEELILPRGYKVILTGHSLGGGVAAVCSLILKSRCPKLFRDTKGKFLQVVSFGTPPVLDYKAALATKSFITSVVNNSDMIPRVSMNNVVVILEFMKTISDKLEEKDLAPKDLKSLTAFIKMLLDDEKMIMSVREMREELAAAQDKVELDDPDHLYCPGQVVHIYDLWSKQGYGEVEDEMEKNMPPINDETVEASVEDVRTAERIVISDGTSKVLRHIEIDSRMFSDHLCPAYKSNIQSLLADAKNQTMLDHVQQVKSNE